MLIIDVYAPYRGDELRVRNQFLDGNLLIPTIATDGFSLVVDLDGPEQLDEFKELALSHGGLPETAVAETGRGCHIWFKTASKIRSRQVGNILFRGESGYVLVPNSRHKSGKIYKWVRDVNLSNVPDWLEAYINEGAQIYENRTIPPLPDYLKKSQQATRSLSVTAKGLQALARQWNQQEEARIRSALAAVSASCRREPWLRIGMALHSLEWVASDGSDRGFEIWREWSSTCPEKFSDHDVETRWRSFKRTGITIGTLFHIAAQFGWTQPLREVGPVAAAKGRDFDPSPAGPATGFSGVSPGALRADHVADNVPVDFHTDVGNAKRFVRRHHENIRHNHSKDTVSRHRANHMSRHTPTGLTAAKEIEALLYKAETSPTWNATVLTIREARRYVEALMMLNLTVPASRAVAPDPNAK